MLNIASSKFSIAINCKDDSSKRKELLEETFRAYVDIVPYRPNSILDYVLKQIKNIEKLLELEIENSVM